MDIIEAIKKIYPDWKGVVWENDYKGIKPHVLEKRPIPTMKELESAWSEVLKDREAGADAEEAETAIQAKIREIAVTALKVDGKLTEDGKIVKP